MHLRFFSILLGITFAVEFFCVFLFKQFGMKTNHPVYNIFMLFEFSAYGIYYLYILTIPWARAAERAAARQSRLEIEHRVEPAMHPDQRRHLPNREQRTVDIRTCAVP